MRSLPWLTKDTKPEEDQQEEAIRLQNKRKSELKSPEPTDTNSPQNAETSDSDNTTISDDVSDVMIPGYDHDDAYIMVEHDLVEAAKQVTRHLHIAAYQKHSLAPINSNVARPTTRRPQRTTELVDEKDGDHMDANLLGKLLRQRPIVAPLTATPIKRRRSGSPVLSGTTKEGERKSKPMNGSRGMQSTKHERFVGDKKPLNDRLDEKDDENEENEDLNKPRKIVKISSPAAGVSKRISSASSRNSANNESTSTSQPSSTNSTLDPDWIFDSLWDEKPPRPSKQPGKREKVSLAAQLEQGPLKSPWQRKAISLKEQFKFMES